MFHPLFVPRYLDYVATESEGGGLLRPVTSCLEGLFHFTVCLLRSHSLSQTYTHPFLSLSCPTLIPILWHSIISPNPCFFLLVHPSIYTLPFLYLAFFPPLYFPLFCSDIKQLTTCLVAGLQCAGRRVLLSFCIYRYFVSRSLSDCFHYVSFCDLRICLKLGYVIQRSL